MADLEKIATDCRAAADYYTDKPELAGSDATIDLYRTIQRLTEAIARKSGAKVRKPEVWL